MGMCDMTDAEDPARWRWWIVGRARAAHAGAGRPSCGSLQDHTGYRFVGLVAMQDPVRDGVVQAVQVARGAGVRVAMITGDYARTAENIALSTGIMQPGEHALEGAELAGLTDDELRRRVGQTSVYARIRPQDKLRIVRALQANGRSRPWWATASMTPGAATGRIGVVVGWRAVTKDIDPILRTATRHRGCHRRGPRHLPEHQKVVAYPSRTLRRCWRSLSPWSWAGPPR